MDETKPLQPDRLPQNRGILTLIEKAQELRISPSTIRKDPPKYGGFKVGGLWRFPPLDYDRIFQENQKVNPVLFPVSTSRRTPSWRRVNYQKGSFGRRGKRVKLILGPSANGLW